MKKGILFVSGLLFMALIISSCASKKATKQAIGDKEIKIPCSNHRSDKNHFRASQSGHSTNMSTSREKAELMTKQRLAGLINTKVKSVTDRYAQDREIANQSEFNEKFENLTRTVVNQSLLEPAIICEKTMQKADGSYNTFMAMEVSIDVIYNGITKAIGSDAKLSQDYDKAKFTETFNKEMQEMEDEQPK